MAWALCACVAHPSHAFHVVSAPGGPEAAQIEVVRQISSCGLGRVIHSFSTCPRSSCYGLGSAQREEVKMGKDTLLVLAELSQAGGTYTLRQMFLPVGYMLS